MHISNLDFKTLTVLATVVRTRSLSKAAAQLGVSQPAISQSFARLRLHFGDALVVRTGLHMEPTPRALELLPAVEEVLSIFNDQLNSRAVFEPKDARRRFNFYATDFGATLMLPKLVSVVRKESPNSSVRAITATLKPAGQHLETGEVDLAIGGFNDLGGGFYQQLLFRDTYVCLAGKQFAQETTRLTKHQFRNASHLVVSPLPQGYDAVEALIRSEVGQDSPIIEVPSFLTLLMVLRESDMICTVPARVGIAMSDMLGLRTFAPPFPLPTLNIKMFWHERLHRDPAHRWFRGLIDSHLRSGN